jgi:DNA adenine methylase
MKYMGSKARFAKEMLPIILRDRKPYQTYVEPFMGGCNMLCEVSGSRIGNDLNPYLVAMWRELTSGELQPIEVMRSDYTYLRNKKDSSKPALVGWVGFVGSYSGSFFGGGYAGRVTTKSGKIRNYQDEAIRNIMKQIPKLSGVVFTCQPYWAVTIPPNSIIYCDPPYAGTTDYKNGVAFDHVVFWDWVRKMTFEGHTVFVSEYAAPDDFRCVWSREVSSSLSANGTSGGNKKSTEKLFIYDELY